MEGTNEILRDTDPKERARRVAAREGNAAERGESLFTVRLQLLLKLTGY